MPTVIVIISAIIVITIKTIMTTHIIGGEAEGLLAQKHMP